MKKIVAITLSLVMIFALCSCGKDDNNNIASNSNISTSESSEVSSTDSKSQSSVPTEESENNNSSEVSSTPQNTNGSEDTGTNPKNPSLNEDSSSSPKQPVSSSSSSNTQNSTSNVSSSTSSTSSEGWGPETCCKDCHYPQKMLNSKLNSEQRCADCQSQKDSGLAYCIYAGHYVESLYAGTNYCFECNKEIMTPPEYTPPEAYYCSNCGREIGTEPGMCEPYQTGETDWDTLSPIWACKWY